MTNTAWIIGASTGIGRQLAENLAASGVDLILSSRNERDLEVISNHLSIHYNTKAFVFPLDLDTIKNVNDSEILIQNLTGKYAFPDTCYFLAGNIHENDASLEAVGTINFLMQVNFLGAVFLINEIIRKKHAQKLQITVASSIAASRARGKNIAYGTAKRALEHYCSGLMHALADTNVVIRVFRFGYIDTNLSYGQKLLFRPVSASYIATKLIKSTGKNSGIKYLPWYWYWIILVINLIPFQIYKKLKF